MIAFASGPGHLQTTRLDAVNADPPLEFTQFVSQGDGVAVAQPQLLGVIGGDDGIVAARSGQFTRATPHDPCQYRSRACRGESLNIGPRVIERYLVGERYAVAAVKAWR